MKYIQDENTSTLFLYCFFGIVMVILVILWDRYDKRKSEERNEYRNNLTMFRLRAMIFIIFIGLYVTVKELIKRF